MNPNFQDETGRRMTGGGASMKGRLQGVEIGIGLEIIGEEKASEGDVTQGTGCCEESCGPQSGGKRVMILNILADCWFAFYGFGTTKAGLKQGDKH
jgi:hypothetical protein